MQRRRRRQTKPRLTQICQAEAEHQQKKPRPGLKWPPPKERWSGSKNKRTLVWISYTEIEEMKATAASYDLANETSSADETQQPLTLLNRSGPSAGKRYCRSKDQNGSG